MKKIIFVFFLFFPFVAHAQTVWYYAGSTNGFYNSSVGVPDDAVAITQSTHDSLMAAQANGQIIQNNNGQPEAVSPPAPSAAQVAQANAEAAIASGIVVTSTLYPDLNGTYSVSPSSASNVNAIVTCILLNGTFCNGTSSQLWTDTSGTTHTFTSVAEFKAYATSFAQYIDAVQVYADSGGSLGSLPSNQISIP